MSGDDGASSLLQLLAFLLAQLFGVAEGEREREMGNGGLRFSFIRGAGVHTR